MTTRRIVSLSVLLGVVALVAGLWLRFGWLWGATAGLLHPLRASFDLRGVVVDEQGNALDAVQLSIAKQHWYGPGDRVIPPDMDRKLVDGYFEAEVRGYAGVILGFSREGYYSERREFDPDSGRRGQGQRTVVDRNIRIVMQKKGVPTKLEPRRSTLVFRPDGTGTVLDLDVPPRRENYGVRDLEPPTTRNLLSVGQLPYRCIYATAPLDAHGRFAVVKDTSQTGPLYLKPQSITLSMTAPEDGFLPFRPQPGKPPRRQMTQAPADGYRRSVVLTPSDAAPGFDDQRAFFYFRSNGKYGRGFVSGSVGPARDDRSVVVATFSLELFTQPDGSRNLEDDDARP